MLPMVLVVLTKRKKTPIKWQKLTKLSLITSGKLVLKER